LKDRLFYLKLRLSSLIYLKVFLNLQDVENLGRKMGFTSNKQNFHNISLGQGQEVVAEEAMEIGAKNGHWVVLQV